MFLVILTRGRDVISMSERRRAVVTVLLALMGSSLRTGVPRPRTRVPSPLLTGPSSGGHHGTAVIDFSHLTRRQNMPRRISRILAVLIGTVLALVALALTANAVPTAASASLTGKATLVAKGAAVDVKFVYSCSPDSVFHDSGAELTQAVRGGHLATGDGANVSELVCDGVQHAAADRVIASVSGGFAFKKGPAVVHWSFGACDVNFDCINIADTSVVQIR